MPKHLKNKISSFFVKSSNSGKSIYLCIGFSLLLLVVIVFVYEQYRSSFFVAPYKRVNIGYWGKISFVLSLDITSPEHTLIIFSNNYSVQIPGGLNGYTIGALGKLVALEKKPLIFKKALSSAGGVLVHKVQYDGTDNIYFDEENTEFNSEVESALRASVFGPGELNIFERIYIFSKISEILSVRTDRVTLTNRKNEIRLYEKTFRSERKLVQILYDKSATTAYEFASMLENVGIRVADVSRAGGGEGMENGEWRMENGELEMQDKEDGLQLTGGSGQGRETDGRCTVVESGQTSSKTSEFLASYFGCRKSTGQTGLYDVKLILGSKVEEEWGR